MSASVRMHQKWASRSRFVKDVASWRRKLVVSWSGQRFKRRSRSVRARSRALRTMPDVVLECSSSDEDAMSLARRESRADFPEVSLQLLDPSEWKLAAYGGFFREENVILEARSILHAVRYAESNSPLGLFLILSDNLALELSL